MDWFIHKEKKVAEGHQEDPPKKLLVIDDEEGFGKMVKWNLDATGTYEVRFETKAARALNTIRVYRPDLILLDMVMPEMDGVSLACQIKSDPALKDIPIIFVTATVTAEEVLAGSGVLGGQFFIAKPVSMEELVSCIKERLPH